MLQDMFSERDWCFFAEGGAHVLCKYEGTDKRWQGMLLRLQKHVSGRKHVSCTLITASQSYQDALISNLLGPSSLVPLQTIFLPQSFVVKLQSRIHEHRPVCRGRDLLCSSVYADHGDAIPAQLLRDVSTLFTSQGSTSTCTVDIKVKSGLRSSSPFVPATRVVKRYHSRFSLVQARKLMLSEQVRSDLLGHVLGVSGYNPLQLTSGYRKEVKSALEKLFESPQNNLRILLDGKSIFDCDIRENQKATWAEEILHLIPSAATTADAAGVLIEMITAVLSAEPVLARLRALQAVDCIEPEGAAVVFTRLRQALAEEGTMETVTVSATTQEAESYLLEQAISTFPTGGTLGSALLLTAEHLMKLYSLSQHTYLRQANCDKACVQVECPLSPAEQRLLDQLPPCVQAIFKMKRDNALDSGRTVGMQAYQMAQTWTASECALHLNLYLLALAASDASVLLSFGTSQQQLPGTGVENEKSVTKIDSSANDNRLDRSSHDMDTIILQDCAVACTQTACSNGKLVCRYGPDITSSEQKMNVCNNTRPEDYTRGCEVLFEYQVQVLDIGMKLPSKCWSKANTEYRLCEAAKKVFF